jgi:hypothetical protein
MERALSAASFLAHNDAFEIVLLRRFPQMVREAMPMFMKNPGGCGRRRRGGG